MKKRVLTLARATALVATAIPAAPAKADDFDPNGSYNAYIGLQSPAFSFRNAWNEPNYGKATEYFNQVTGWSGSDAVTVPGTFTDAVIAGNGTYTVSADGLDFGDYWGSGDTLNLLFVSTDLPAGEGESAGEATTAYEISNVVVTIDGNEVDNPNGVFYDADAAKSGYAQLALANIWNSDLEALGYYNAPMSSISISFDISGFNYNKGETPSADTPAEEAPAEETPADLPKTGTAPVVLYVGLGAAMLLGGAVLAKKERA